MTRARKFWRIYLPGGGTDLVSFDPREELDEGETAQPVKLDGITWREFAELMDREAADSHHTSLEGVHEWLARRIIRATSDDRVLGEIIAQKVLRSVYEEYGGLHND